ncbi:vitamin D 25-hydroxylase-like protein [Dinothrombium tinctorium]|uniref:Vitamin D 25-hydroxylase-like protein n=1 Tax=Dinothrombium tinctorium TaxID=1965070 RepID=A0A443QVX2_9ACAR|nr:vitamin D 25-hydroxylase-like protein [Dinothrombium tinctorium]
MGEQLIGNLIQFIIAGSDTTTNTMYFACYMLAKHPNIQAAMQKEIDEVVGNERFPTLEDRRVLIYTEAFFREIDRYYALAPISIIRVNSDEVMVQGFKIPKGCNFIANTNNCLRDSKYFKNPFEFDPDNFINSNGELINVQSFVPFGIGKLHGK